MARTGPSLALVLALAASSARAGDVSVRLDSGTGFSVRNAAGSIERLRVDEATGNVSRNGALFVHTTGFDSVFVGPGAGPVNAQSGVSGFGVQALEGNTTGYHNSAFGSRALRSNTVGNANSAFGFEALRSNTTGSQSDAFGRLTLYNNTTGSRNTAFGTYALRANTTGSRNVAIGYAAGQAVTTGNDNIYIGSNGLPGDSGQIRIGGVQTGAHIAGIFGSTASSGIPVLVNAFGTLGTSTSSARFKQDVRDMADASDVLMKLRPVTFRYREEVVGAEDAKTPQYGLIAEEVAEVAPELIVADGEGRPYSVKYHELPALLVAEAQKQRSAAASQERRLAEQSARIASQQQEIASLTSRLARLEAERARATAAVAR